MKTIGHGYYWNDLEVGFKFRTLNRTITESDLVGFINTTGMLEMIFIDQTFAHEGGIKGRVVPAALPIPHGGVAVPDRATDEGPRPARDREEGPEAHARW